MSNKKMDQTQGIAMDHLPLFHFEQPDVFSQIKGLASLPLEDRIEQINKIKLALHEVSPFRNEPVDCVLWAKNTDVHANDYNPNSVAPPEMELLRVSIDADGYTQPIVTMPDDAGFEVVDGFHRHRVGKEMADVRERVHGYLPIVRIRATQQAKEDRIASTIRHNRARGKHKVEAMSDIVVELKRRNWTDEKIAKNLGMDQDEILRLCQITGLADIFSDQEFSQAWEAVGSIRPEDFEGIEDISAEAVEVRTANTDDPDRIFHTFDVWECHKAGFYESRPPAGMSADDCKRIYAELLADEAAFREALQGVITQWKHSCEHYLTNSAMNRIAWLGQASLCYARGIPSEFRGGYQLLTEAQQLRADEIALEALNEWMTANNRAAIPMEEANPSRQADIY